MTRVVHYLNQFFGGLGGEEAAGTGPSVVQGPVGPGRKLQSLIAPEHEIVATVVCGDDYAASEPGAIDEVLALVREAEAEMLVAGPAFGSGRYGMACARLAAAARDAGLPCVASMHEDNPGIDEAAGAPVVASAPTSRGMADSLAALAAAVQKVAAGGLFEGRIGKIPRRNVVADESSAARAVDLVLARLAGNRDATEVPLPRFDRVAPAAPVADPGEAVVALLTEGGLVADGNPDRLESARATRWLRYSLEGVDSLSPDRFTCVHGGFSTVWANEDPHRILPLDVARELEREGVIGRLFPAYFVTTGNGTSVAAARRFGVEWAAELRRAGVQAAILTAT